MTTKLTPASTELFKELAEDADASGVSLYVGGVASSVSRNGNLTDLKKKGLITADKVRYGGAWVYFTPEGREFASSEFSIELENCEAQQGLRN